MLCHVLGRCGAFSTSFHTVLAAREEGAAGRRAVEAVALQLCKQVCAGWQSQAAHPEIRMPHRAEIGRELRAGSGSGGVAAVQACVRRVAAAGCAPGDSSAAPGRDWEKKQGRAGCGLRMGLLGEQAGDGGIGAGKGHAFVLRACSFYFHVKGGTSDSRFGGCTFLSTVQV